MKNPIIPPYNKDLNMDLFVLSFFINLEFTNGMAIMNILPKTNM